MKILLFVFFSLFISSVSAQCTRTYNSACAVRTAMNLVQKATCAINNAPTPDAMRQVWNEITNGNTYKSNDFYVFVYDWLDHNKAHGRDPTNVGIELKDILAKYGSYSQYNLGGILRSAANTTGGSFASYEWAEGANSPALPNRAWLRRVTKFGIDYYIGSSWNYVEQEAAGASCLQRRCSVCSAEHSKNLVDAVRYAMSAACNASALDDIFNAITYRGAFRIPTGYYVFVNTYSGITVAHGLNPAFVGKDLQGISSLVGSFGAVPANLNDQYVTASRDQGGNWVQSPWADLIQGSVSSTYTYTAPVRAVNVNYYVGSGFLDIKDPTCPNCNCVQCPLNPTCAPCQEAQDEVVTSITFRFKGLTCAGDKC